MYFLLFFFVFAIHQPLRSASPAPAAARSLHFRHRDEYPLTLSPFFATLTSTAQITENTSALSPFLATLIDLSGVTPLFATPLPREKSRGTKTTGVWSNSSHCGTQRQPAVASTRRGVPARRGEPARRGGRVPPVPTCPDPVGSLSGSPIGAGSPLNARSSRLPKTTAKGIARSMASAVNPSLLPPVNCQLLTVNLPFRSCLSA